MAAVGSTLLATLHLIGGVMHAVARGRRICDLHSLDSHRCRLLNIASLHVRRGEEGQIELTSPHVPRVHLQRFCGETLCEIAAL
ncbi:MAG: hypothetical protein QOE61_270 [Micromonosporaceae bacterium]|nr:hypothetical protein [Micromonosporaceae bacterium]